MEESMCMCSVMSWLFVISWTVSTWAPQFMEFFRQEYWGGVPFPPPRDLSNPGIEPTSPALAGGFFTTRATWEAPCVWAHWNHSFDMHLNCLRDHPAFLHPESPQGAPLGEAAAADGLLSVTPWFIDMAGDNSICNLHKCFSLGWTDLVKCLVVSKGLVSWRINLEIFLRQ